jgi:hypothetical protein
VTITRQLYEINTASTKTDTGPPAHGEFIQARWELTGAADTGADLEIYAQQREADTGNGVPVVVDNDCLGTDFVRQYRAPLHNIDGVAVDTGNDACAPVVFAGERPRVRVIPAGGTAIGRLYLWFKT